jgi:hypothetical protein
MWPTDKDAELLLFMFAFGLGAGGAIFKKHCLSHKDRCNARLEAVKSFKKHRLHQSGRNVRLKIVKPSDFDAGPSCVSWPERPERSTLVSIMHKAAQGCTNQHSCYSLLQAQIFALSGDGLYHQCSFNCSYSSILQWKYLVG